MGNQLTGYCDSSGRRIAGSQLSDDFDAETVDC
jgi:hypothetical protein